MKRGFILQQKPFTRTALPNTIHRALGS